MNYAYKFHVFLGIMATDRESKFINALRRALMKRWGIEYSMTTANYSVADGQMERSKCAVAK